MRTYEVLTNKFLRWYRCTWFFALPTLQKGYFLLKLAIVLYFFYIGVRLVELVIMVQG